MLTTMPPFFSVIIPAYNCGHLIGETLDSALEQDFDDFEIIVVNDGSTDSTRDVLETYAKKQGMRIQVIDQENKGEGGGRNRGIFSAQGKYLAFLDQDDLWFPWTLLTYYDALKANGFPAVLIGSGQEFSDIETIKSIKFAPQKTKYFSDYFSLAKHPYIPAGTPGTVVRTDEARRVGGLSTARVIGIDQEFFYKLGDAQGVAYVISPTTVAIRRHSGNLQRNIEMTAKGALFLIRGEIDNRYPGGDERKWDRRVIISRMVRTMSLRCLRAKYFSEGWEIYFRTLLWNLRLGRLKYLLGFPIKYVFEKVIKS